MRAVSGLRREGSRAAVTMIWSSSFQRLILAPVSPPSFPDLVLALLPLLSCQMGRISILVHSPTAVVSAWKPGLGGSEQKAQSLARAPA